jgi:hypothetical protein
VRLRLALLVAVAAAGCTAVNVVPPFANTDQTKSAADAVRTDTSFIPPTDPRYSETGAPRAGEPTGASISGDPRLLGDGRSYAPVGGGRKR